MKTFLELALHLAALAQLAIALLNFSLVPLMGWKPELARLPLLIREVFQVHLFFISITVGLFAILTWRFAHQMAFSADPLAAWLATGIGIFWATRSVMQWTNYSTGHWRGNATRTALHVLLFFGYGALGAVYLAAGLFPR
ncbi:MAG TPA: hypothetical protein VGL24_09490 [Chthoniobacterales bacterium]